MYSRLNEQVATNRSWDPGLRGLDLIYRYYAFQGQHCLSPDIVRVEEHWSLAPMREGPNDQKGTAFKQ